MRPTVHLTVDRDDRAHISRRDYTATVRKQSGSWPAAWAVGLAATAALAILMWAFGDDGSVRGGCTALGIMTLSSVWATWDSHAIRIVRYKTQMANEPVMVLFLCMTAWPIAFPWYVIVRVGIRYGLVPLKRPVDA